MKLFRKIAQLDLIAPEKLLELYPPFLFMGVKIREVAKDFRSLKIILPLRWYGTNHHGTMFGGFMCAVSDPLPALLCSRIFPETESWTRSNCVFFKRPARSVLEAQVEITEQDYQTLSTALATEGKATHVFEFAFTDTQGRTIAKVKNTVFLKKRIRTSSKPSPIAAGDDS